MKHSFNTFPKLGIVMEEPIHPQEEDGSFYLTIISNSRPIHDPWGAQKAKVRRNNFKVILGGKSYDNGKQ